MDSTIRLKEYMLIPTLFNKSHATLLENHSTQDTIPKYQSLALSARRHLLDTENSIERVNTSIDRTLPPPPHFKLKL